MFAIEPYFNNVKRPLEKKKKKKDFYHKSMNVAKGNISNPKLNYANY